MVGYVSRRLGNWEEALAAFDKAAALDPLDATLLYDLGANTLVGLGRYQEAVAWYGRALELAPDVASWDMSRGWTWVAWDGSLDSVRAALDRQSRGASWLSAAGAEYLLWAREPDSLLALLERIPAPVFVSQYQYHPKALWSGWAHQLRDDDVAARAAFDSALVLLDSAMTALPDDWRVHGARGIALAGLRRREEARREASWLQSSVEYREDAYGRGPPQGRALILANVGETDLALGEIERLLAEPPFVSVQYFRLDPRYDPIRNDPRFQALLAKYAEPKPVW